MRPYAFGQADYDSSAARPSKQLATTVVATPFCHFHHIASRIPFEVPKSLMPSLPLFSPATPTQKLNAGAIFHFDRRRHDADA